ncbi:SRPBCC family protein [Kitasatospora sp. NPDC058162]|uniref:SRPBCC family protein n=1 Tax=Kitasatospora sp. NPDC058162 TaxID=3346362 RepID=UPI0036DF8239
MSRLVEQIDIDAPADQVWAQLNEFDAYPQFVDGVRSAFVDRGDRARFEVSIGGEQRELISELNQRTNERELGWRTISGSPDLKGALAVREVDAGHCELQARLEYDGDELREAFGGPKGFAQVRAVEQAVRTDLEHFKELVEKR